MIARLPTVLAGAWLLLHALSGWAATYALDDSGSQVFPPAAQWQWAPGTLRSGLNTVHMQVRVNVRIDTRAWVGRPGRIYMTLPLDGGGAVTANWETQGLLIGGRLVSGERALVFSGPVPGPVLEDTLSVSLATDARLMTGDVQRLAFHFELDTP